MSKFSQDEIEYVIDQVMKRYLPSPIELMSKLEKDLDIYRTPKGEERYKDTFTEGKIRHYVVIELLPKFDHILDYLTRGQSSEGIFSNYNSVRAQFVRRATHELIKMFKEYSSPAPVEPKESFPGLSHVPLTQAAIKPEIPLSASKTLDKDTIEKMYTDSVPGGKADAKNPSDYDFDQLEKGIDVELEHTDDAMLALEIAMDHLEENPKYYDYLLEMEKEWKTHSSLKPLLFS